jgi:hypothetical protein
MRRVGFMPTAVYEPIGANPNRVSVGSPYILRSSRELWRVFFFTSAG